MPPPRMHAEEVDIDGPLVRRLLADQMSEYLSLPLRRGPWGGTENAVFRLGDDLALRMPVAELQVIGMTGELWAAGIRPWAAACRVRCRLPRQSRRVRGPH